MNPPATRKGLSRIEFSFEGLAKHSGHVTLGGLLYQLSNLYNALKHADRLITGAPKPTVHFRVVDLRHTSPATITIEARPVKSDRDYTEEIMGGFVGAMDQIGTDGKAPEWADRDFLKHISAINRPVGRSVRAARISHGGTEVHLTHELQHKIEVILAPEETFGGSIKGRLEAINLHDDENTFRIYPAVGPQRVICRFPDELRDEAIGAVDRGVVVEGLMKYRANADFPEEIEVRSIEILPKDDELPTLDELRGIAPGLIEGKTAAEYVRGIRDEWD